MREDRGDRVVDFAARHLPYGAVSGVAPWLVGWRAFQRGSLGREARRFQAMRPLSRDPANFRRATGRFLASTGWRRLYEWRLQAAQHGDPKDLQRWFPVEGIERLERARSVGRGVVLLNSHYGLGRLVPYFLTARGIPMLSIEGRAMLQSEGLEVLSVSTSFPAQVLRRGRQALQEGRVVHTTGDGYQGQSGEALPFLGRERRFPEGFAMLAVRCEALVVPVFAPVDDRGRVRIQIQEPLSTGDPSIDRAVRASELIQQYIRMLEDRWTSDPGNITTGHVSKYLALPRQA